jgi:hypothetical protein
MEFDDEIDKAAAEIERVLDSGAVRESPEMARATAEAQRVLASGDVRQSAEMPDMFMFLPEKERKQDRELKLSYATWLRWLLAAQLAIADVVFVVYAWAGERWNLHPAVINIWLGATVVQVVGVVLVVTRHLFPLRDHAIAQEQKARETGRIATKTR